MGERRRDSDPACEYRTRQVEMLVARYRAAERSLVVALTENLALLRSRQN